jgi:acyl carrier protein
VTGIVNIDEKIRNILLKHAGLGSEAQSISVDEDLHQAGMTSMSSVNVMLGLEGEFDIEFPDHMLNKKVFSSIGSIRAAILELTA